MAFRRFLSFLPFSFTLRIDKTLKSWYHINTKAQFGNAMFEFGDVWPSYDQTPVKKIKAGIDAGSVLPFLSLNERAKEIPRRYNRNSFAPSNQQAGLTKDDNRVNFKT